MAHAAGRLAALAALSFERNRIGVNQILAVRVPASGGSGMPATRGVWPPP